MQKASAPASVHPGIAKLLEDTRKRLVETGTRNRLVHVNRANARGNVINIVDASCDGVYGLLADRKVMRFRASGSEDRNSGSAEQVRETVGRSERGDRLEITLDTRVAPDVLQKKLLKIAGEAKTAEEESGVNILYLAVGFMTWFEDKSSNLTREAPLVLLPVELIRNARTSTHDLKLRDDDVLTNLPLQQRLRDDFGIDLPDLEIEEGWKPSSYFGQVHSVIQQQPRWCIDQNAMQIGFFSFSKLLMYRDLAPEAWPSGALATHALTRGLLYEGFGSEPPIFGSGQKLDDVLPPEKLFHVINADGSQAKVIEEVRSGRNLVVQGPPGTGKSQTITNIIATAVKEGKRVLFLAEKMAALSVVHDRLVKVGLRDVCLELHSRSANKKAVLGELARTINQASAVPNVPASPAKLRDVRDRLNELTKTLHQPIGNTGETPFSVLGRQARFMGEGATPPRLKAPELLSMTRRGESSLVKTILQLGDLLGTDATANPFEGVGNLDLQPVDLARASVMLETAARHAALLANILLTTFGELGLDAVATLESTMLTIDLLDRLQSLPLQSIDIARRIVHSVADVSRLSEVAQAGAVWKRAHAIQAKVFTEQAFSSAVIHLRGPLAAGAKSFVTRFGKSYRSASRDLATLLRGNLPKLAKDRIGLVDSLFDIATSRSAWEGDAEYCSRTLGEAWRGEHSDFELIMATALWCRRLSGAKLQGKLDNMLAIAATVQLLERRSQTLASTQMAAQASIDQTASLLALNSKMFGTNDMQSTPLDVIAARFAEMAASAHRYNSWAEIVRLTKEMDAAGCSSLVERMRTGEFGAEAAATELRFARAEALWQAALSQSFVLRSLRAQKRHEIAASFVTLERQHLVDNVTTVLSSHLAQMPQGAQGEMGIVRGEIAKKARHMATRRLFERASTALQRIKPVLLMSPISVAQFLPPGKVSFDLLVIDEASQVRPEDALGAISRTKQIVVVGDPKQLPPSSFFDRVAAESDETDAHDDEGENLLKGGAQLGQMESILTLCEARGLSSRMLQWHYRSRDPSLIAVSNQEFYGGSLILPPSPVQQDPSYGLCFTRVDGVYDRGGKKDNRIEGEAIVRRIAEHARAHSSQSLGVVTFSYAQRNAITELLEHSRRSDPVLDGFLHEGQIEDVFVKNIENVQGDERDVILVSVGYGPIVAGGRLTSMSFGPVNSDGGERRLNVLFTRARVRCEIFASFDPGDLDLGRTASRGIRVLKRFLQFAQDGQIEEKSSTGLPADSPFEEDVAVVIRSFGFIADPQVGSSGFRIDLGVRHPDSPGTYILAVECDGATYHSALWARERDRLRQEVLESLGWKFHRIWSSDWFYNRSTELERLRQALASAKVEAQHGIRLTGANVQKPSSAFHEGDQPAIVDITAPTVRQMPPYQRASIALRSAQEPHEVPRSVLTSLAKRIVAAEGPIHVEEIARRIATAFGKEKAGSRIIAATRESLADLISPIGNLLSDDDFWFTTEQRRTPPIRDRSTESGATLKAACISMLEIREALRVAREDCAGGDDDDLIRTAARLLGYKRVGHDLHARITNGLR